MKEIELKVTIYLKEGQKVDSDHICEKVGEALTHSDNILQVSRAVAVSHPSNVESGEWYKETE